MSHLKVIKGQQLTDICDTLAEHVSKHSSSSNYTEQLQNIKRDKEKQNHNFSSGKTEKI